VDVNDSGYFEPVHSAHAIEQVVVFCRFDKMLDDVQFSKIRSDSEVFKEELPGKHELQMFTVNFSVPGQFAPQNAQASGFMMSRTAPDSSVERELRVERNALTLRTTVYKRWANFLSDVDKYLASLMPSYVSAGARIASIGLSVVDKFVWNSATAIPTPDKLLRRDSRYLSPHLINAPDLWHCHTGIFDFIGSDTKRLLNINVDCLNESPAGASRRAIVMTKIVTDFFNQQGLKDTIVDDTNVGPLIRQKMTDLHNSEKAILADLISDQMASRIALTGE
jgi:uncharacterized protein (TIGR04255 family)